MKIKQLSDRFAILDPIDRHPAMPKVFGLRKALVKAGILPICQCGKVSKLDAHHIKPIQYLRNANGHTYQDPQGDHTATNGQWLCRSCHSKLHNT